MKFIFFGLLCWLIPGFFIKELRGSGFEFLIIIIVLNLLMLGFPLQQLLFRIFPGLEIWVYDNPTETEVKNLYSNSYYHIRTPPKRNRKKYNSTSNMKIKLPKSWILNKDMVGIYRITNTKNKKVYIGESINISKRWERHFYDLRINQHHNYGLQKDFNSQIENDFYPEIIQVLNYTTYEDTKIRLLLAEKAQIELEKYQGKIVYNYDNSHYINDEKEISPEYINNDNDPHTEADILEDTLKSQYKLNIKDFTDATQYWEDDFSVFRLYENKIIDNFEDIKQLVINKKNLHDIYNKYTTEKEKIYITFDFFKRICREQYTLGKEENLQNNSQKLREKQANLYGVGGWLKWFIFSCYYIVPILGLMLTSSNLTTIEVSYPALIEYQGWKDYKFFSYCLTIIYIFITWMIAHDLKHNFVENSIKNVKKYLLFAAPSNMLLDVLILSNCMDIPFFKLFGSELIPLIMKGIIPSLIWYAYFSRSKRILNTYYSINNNIVDEYLPTNNNIDLKSIIEEEDYEDDSLSNNTIDLKSIIDEEDYDYAYSQYELGKLAYENGNFPEAAIHYQNAALKDDRDAQLELSLLLYEGKGCNKDIRKSAYWCQKAALLHSKSAMARLSILFEKGVGVTQDMKKSKYWLARSNKE